MGRKKLDLTGQRFGRLVAIRDSGERGIAREVLWECKCDCGEISFVRSGSLRSGNTESCGCLSKEVNSKKIKTKGYHAKIIEAKKGKDLVEETSLSHLTQKTNSNNTSGHKGVYWTKSNKKWQSKIMIRGESINLGYFADKQDAINARLEAEEKYFKPILEKYEKKTDRHQAKSVKKINIYEVIIP
ncbi:MULTISPECIES: AP2 domain-containing protein [Lactobacillales]|uniref:AP2 domain-containing protein n=1 Tax=Lactobacillales TaxID=186826 RepID=UPI00026C8333|nr:AP2 domain-containing protein [Carnobacterium maltaromaticum]